MTEHRTKTTKEKRSLRCQLTQTELLAAGEKLADLLDTLRCTVSERENVTKQYKAKEAELEAQIETQQLLVRNKSEIRTVDHCRPQAHGGREAEHDAVRRREGQGHGRRAHGRAKLAPRRRALGGGQGQQDATPASSLIMLNPSPQPLVAVGTNGGADGSGCKPRHERPM